MSLSGAFATIPETVPRRVVGGGAVWSGWLRLPVIIGGLLVVLLALSGYIASVVAGPDSIIASAVNNLGQLAAAFGATLAAAVAVHRHTGRQRRAWLLVAVACGSWTAGQLIWYVEVVRAEEVPQVSIADLFFLAFTALMAVAVWPSGGRHTDRLRTLLDAVVIGLSLFAISWVTSINQVASATTDDNGGLLGLLVNLAYPCGDIVVLTMVLLGVSRWTDRASSLTAVAAAMALIAVSDGFYAYITASGAFDPGSVTGLGWIAGFGLIGCAALAGGRVPAPRAGSSFLTDPREGDQLAGRVGMLPYIPLAVALIIVAVDRSGDGTDRVTGIVVIITL